MAAMLLIVITAFWIKRPEGFLGEEKKFEERTEKKKSLNCSLLT